MNKRGKFQALTLLLLVALPLMLLLAACKGDKGDPGAAGAAGADLKDPTAATSGTFLSQISPLFTKNDQFFDGALACTTCHYGDSSTTSFHGINFNSYAGILLGPTDAAATGEDLLGRPSTCTDLTVVNTTTCKPNWDESAMAHRLRDTRMPPGWDFDLFQSNRDTPEIKTIRAWLTDGALDAVTAGKVTYSTVGTNLFVDDDGNAATVDPVKESSATFTGTKTAILWTSGNPPATVSALFTASGAFFVGSQACTQCHNDPTKSFSWHSLDFSSYAGILKGPQDKAAYSEDLLGRPSTCDLTKASVATADGCVPVVDDSALLKRLRDTRMPPGWAFELGQSNRDMWAILQMKAWVDAGAPNGSY